MGFAPNLSGGPAPGPTAKTLVGVASPARAPSVFASPEPALPAASEPAAPIAPVAPQRTLLGVARPGIAPLRPGERPAERSAGPERPADPERPELADELGATIAPRRHTPVLRELGKRHVIAFADPKPRAAAKARAKRTRRGGKIAMAAAGALVAAAGIVAVLWRSAPPLTARVRVDAAGREVVAVSCASCPDGTRVRARGGEATIAGRRAEIPVGQPLSVGDNLLDVAIDRPGKGRDERVEVGVRVGYRIRPDLRTLEGEKPAVHVVVEAAFGTKVTLAGKPVPLGDGRASVPIDVSDALSGMSDQPTTLLREIPYVVTSESGETEEGKVKISLPVVPLRIDAPGPSIVIQDATFTLAGRTSRGAKVLAAGRPIPVKPDGSFAQKMNVDRLGAAEIVVRASLPGAAPRLVPIGIRRVDDLEAVARAFSARSPVPMSELFKDAAAQVGKPAAIAGELVEARTQNHQTVMIVEVPAEKGCPAPGSCKVRLVHGDAPRFAKGEKLTAYGTVSDPARVPGLGVIPELSVAFALPGLR